MPGKKHSREDIEARLRQVEELTRQGKTVTEAIQSIGIGGATYYRWRKGAAGLNADPTQRLKELELENARLRQAVLDLTLDKMVLQEARRN